MNPPLCIMLSRGWTTTSHNPISPTTLKLIVDMLILMDGDAALCTQHPAQHRRVIQLFLDEHMFLLLREELLVETHIRCMRAW